MCDLLKLFDFRKEVTVVDGMASTTLRHLSPSSCYFFDAVYYYPDAQTWASIIREVIFGLPAYLEDRFDCDDYSLVVKARIAERYKINGMGIVVGNSPNGYHAWNIYILDGELHYLEPQTGEVWPIDSNPKYKAEMILW